MAEGHTVYTYSLHSFQLNGTQLTLIVYSTLILAESHRVYTYNLHTNWLSGITHVYRLAGCHMIYTYSLGLHLYWLRATGFTLTVLAESIHTALLEDRS